MKKIVSLLFAFSLSLAIPAMGHTSMSLRRKMLQKPNLILAMSQGTMPTWPGATAISIQKWRMDGLQETRGLGLTGRSATNGFPTRKLEPVSSTKAIPQVERK